MFLTFCKMVEEFSVAQELKQSSNKFKIDIIRPCGCKGVRTCLQCEREFNIEKPTHYNEFQKLRSLVYCLKCERLFSGWNVEQVQFEHPSHNAAEGIPFTGVLVQTNFLSESEGANVLQQLDELPWDISQSGRRKQNFGPKTNFKKRKLQNGTFNGFPAFTEFIQLRFCEKVDILHDFQTIEQCTLEYDPSKGASIDPHIDDCWVWGERVVTVNCQGDAVLTLNPYDPSKDLRKYNLNVVEKYKENLLLPWHDAEKLAEFRESVIRIPMPNLSLIVLYGPARFQFEHSVLREDIKERRVCIAYREFTPMYIHGSDTKKGAEVIRNAQHFWQHKV